MRDKRSPVLPISRRTLGNWKAKGIHPYIKIGRRCLYDWASVQGALLGRQRGGKWWTTCSRKSRLAISISLSFVEFKSDSLRTSQLKDEPLSFNKKMTV